MEWHSTPEGKFLKTFNDGVFEKCPFYCKTYYLLSHKSFRAEHGWEQRVFGQSTLRQKHCKKYYLSDHKKFSGRARSLPENCPKTLCFGGQIFGQSTVLEAKFSGRAVWGAKFSGRAAWGKRSFRAEQCGEKEVFGQSSFPAFLQRG